MDKFTTGSCWCARLYGTAEMIIQSDTMERNSNNQREKLQLICDLLKIVSNHYH